MRYFFVLIMADITIAAANVPTNTFNNLVLFSSMETSVLIVVALIMSDTGCINAANGFVDGVGILSFV